MIYTLCDWKTKKKLFQNKYGKWLYGILMEKPSPSCTKSAIGRIEFRKSYHVIYFIKYLFERVMFGNDTAALCAYSIHHYKRWKRRRCAEASPPVCNCVLYSCYFPLSLSIPLFISLSLLRAFSFVSSMCAMHSRCWYARRVPRKWMSNVRNVSVQNP